ncbi:SDR family NAD(P)-dependent oxidoreductase [Chitinophaga rhizosphaerae]|uniref:SDR family NAD(P)-dependent oxidoreductase n=1 Tax=Chitinophaga rhizosphaerae TaxID=1864947 RepID=UPI000F7FD696|nr:SDR family oxidoreductase [Chitinophaga rhizosphaerae]
MQTLIDKTALVTGGNSGIGYAAAKALAGSGARVIITGRRKPAVDKAASELGAVGMIADQANVTDITALAQGIAMQYGQIDVLVVNAGVSRLTAIADASEELFDEVMDVNLKGAYFTLSRFIPLLRDGASVILVSSSSAVTAKPQTSIYTASKAAINALVKVAAVELAPRGIRVNTVSPGPFSTAIMEKAGLDHPDTQHFILAGVPLARLGVPEEAGNLIRFLAGNDAAYITGADFLIDGGQSLNK